MRRIVFPVAMLQWNLGEVVQWNVAVVRGLLQRVEIHPGMAPVRQECSNMNARGTPLSCSNLPVCYQTPPF